ncbi:FKBP-type peptidyl-prolyl cis-trans isomerase [Undibacterium sp. Ji22W]|uniref:FKBP-type peptidyl-prolyl cis-trans isomerase n=1 Tax=Undibacterium sp. Ji22W TaxID=3413038 RepID=UPI003BF1E595
MSEKSILVVNNGAYLTLHYRLATLDGEDIISTFHESPATLLLGQGQLAPNLEQALLGLEEGTHTTQELTPEQAFGVRNPDLIQRVSLKTLRENSAFGEQFKVGDLIDFSAPSGGKFAGVIQELDEDSALFDFNHPLAGQRMLFEVKIIGIL